MPMEEDNKFQLPGFCFMCLAPSAVLSPFYYKTWYGDNCQELVKFCNETVNYCQDKTYKKELTDLKNCKNIFVAAICLTALAGISFFSLLYLLYDKNAVKKCNCKSDDDNQNVRQIVVTSNEPFGQSNDLNSRSSIPLAVIRNP